jgi:hypothetical protein
MSKSRDDWTPLNMTTQHQVRGRPPQARVAFHQNRAAGNGALLGRSLPGFGGSGPPASATACPASMCFTPVISTPLANDPGAHLSVTLAPRLPSVAESKTLQKRRGQPLRIGHLRRDTTPRTRPSAHTLSYLSSSSPARRLRRRRAIPPLVRGRSSPAPSRSSRGEASFHTT